MTRFGYAMTAISFGLALAACGPREQLAACKIADKACQEDIYYALVRMRGDGFDPLAGVPPIITITEEQYRKRLEKMQPQPVAQPPDDPEEEEKPKIKPWDVALQILGLIEPKKSSGSASIDNQVSRVAAFYSSADKKVTVIDRGGERNDFRDTALLLHELVHAFQDRELAGDLTDGTTDGFSAARALTEGEATFYEFLSHAEMQNIDPLSIDWEAHYGNWLLGGRLALAKERSLFHSVRWFIYPMGARHIANAWLDGGNGGVRHAYADPQRFGVQYMVGYHGDSSPLSPALACSLTPAEGYAAAGQDRFGALQVYAFLTANQPHPHLLAETEEEAAALAEPHARAEAETWDVASAWVDDRVLVLLNEEEQLVQVTWRIRFREPEHPERAIELLELGEELSARADGTDLVLTGGSTAEARANFTGFTHCD